MDRRQKIRLAAMLLVRNQHLFERKLKLLLPKLLQNVKKIHTLAANSLHVLLQVGIAVGHSELTQRQIWNFNRDSTFWECDMLTMDDNRFKEHFRVNRETFQKLCEKVRSIERVDTNMRLSIPLDKRVAIALFALGSAAEYRTVGRLFGVGRTTIGKIVIDFCHAICDNLSYYINSYPPHPQEIEHIVGGFERLGFPQCFGAVDGCHIEVQPRKQDAIDYYNFKGWYSVVLLASCDYRSKFTYINIGSSGKNDHSYIFQQSSLKRFHESAEIFKQNKKVIRDINVPLLLIGDSAFRLSQYMMKPFPHSINQSDIEKIFNYRLSRCRRVIETAFRQLKARFRKIGSVLLVAPKNVNIIIKTCCILHNFLKIENDEVSSAWMENIAGELTTRRQPNHSTRVGESDGAAIAIRNAIALSFKDDGADENVVSRGDRGEGGDSNGSDCEDGNGSDSVNGWQLASGVFT